MVNQQLDLTVFVDKGKYSEDFVFSQNLLQISVAHVVPNVLHVSDHKIFDVNVVHACEQ